MSTTNTVQKASQLRSFGLTVASGFAIIALLPLLRHHGPRIWSVAIALALAVAALAAPGVLRPVHRVWMTVGEALGWVNSRIILTVIYYLLIVPTGLFRRLRHDDPLRLKLQPGAQTYKTPRVKRPASHMSHQF